MLRSGRVSRLRGSRCRPGLPPSTSSDRCPDRRRGRVRRARRPARRARRARRAGSTRRSRVPSARSRTARARRIAVLHEDVAEGEKDALPDVRDDAAVVAHAPLARLRAVGIRDGESARTARDEVARRDRRVDRRKCVGEGGVRAEAGRPRAPRGRSRTAQRIGARARLRLPAARSARVRAVRVARLPARTARRAASARSPVTASSASRRRSPTSPRCAGCAGTARATSRCG